MIAPKEHSLQFRPRLVLAHTSAAFTTAASRHLCLLAWEVHTTDSGQEARRLVDMLDPAVVVLATNLADESGWLTCNKMVRAQPNRKVVLVAPEATSEDQAFAGFVGASAMVRESDGMAALVDAIHGTALSAVSG
jgi:DNA-binding response OmpR family regulator